MVVVQLNTIFQSMPGVTRILQQRPISSDRVKCVGSKSKLSNQGPKDCVLNTCCNSYSFCHRSRAAKKERLKPCSLSDRNKACPKCFFCLSLTFRPSCSKCPQCCRKSNYRVQVAKVFGNMAQSLVVPLLQEAYKLPFKMRPPLIWSPLIVSGYTNPLKNSYLKEALRSLIIKQAVEKVVV